MGEHVPRLCSNDSGVRSWLLQPVLLTTWLRGPALDLPGTCLTHIFFHACKSIPSNSADSSPSCRSGRSRFSLDCVWPISTSSCLDHRLLRVLPFPLLPRWLKPSLISSHPWPAVKYLSALKRHAFSICLLFFFFFLYFDWPNYMQVSWGMMWCVNINICYVIIQL